jgi:hypothetical protein
MKLCSVPDPLSSVSEHFFAGIDGYDFSPMIE